MMRQSKDIGPVLLSLVTFVSLCCLVLGHPNEQQSDEITLEREQIFVHVLDGPTFSLTVEPIEAGWELRSDIEEIEGIPYERVQLKIGNNTLDEGKQLSESNIHARDTLTLEIPEHFSRRLVEFSVKTLAGRELHVRTQIGNSVASLKENITQWAGIPQAEQRLLFRGKELKDERRKLVHYDISDGTTIIQGVQLEDCRRVVTIFVRTLSGATIEVEVDLAGTVTDLKERIWQKAGIPTGVQRLNANRRLIAGEDHLCDLGLKAGSIVYMWLYSSQITSLDQVARLKEQPSTFPENNYRAPIFREVEDSAEFVQSNRRPAQLYKDARNWVARGGSRPGRILTLFDPVARLEPNPDYEHSMQFYQKNLETLSRPAASASDRLDAARVHAHIKLSLAVRPYRVAANISSVGYPEQYPGITLGGGTIYVRPKQLVPLGADINNWAPDAFSDSDIMRLFRVAERVRQVLSRDALTGEALACYPSTVAYDSASEDEDCAICWDGLPVEPAIKLPCEHAFHVECMQTWVANIYRWPDFPACPYCSQRFMFPYELQGKAELETPELQHDQDN